MFTILFALMTAVGIVSCKVGWRKENKKNWWLYSGVILLVLVALFIVLAIILGTVVFAFKIAWGMIVALFIILWYLKWLLLIVALVSMFFWLKNRWVNKNK